VRQIKLARSALWRTVHPVLTHASIVGDIAGIGEFGENLYILIDWTRQIKMLNLLRVMHKVNVNSTLYSIFTSETKNICI